MELLDLPDEVILKILVHLSRRELSSNVRPTCRRLREMSYDRSLSQVINISLAEGISSNGICKLIDMSYRLSHFSVKAPPSQRYLDIEIIEHLYQHSETLKVLSFEYCVVKDDNKLFKLVKLCHKLVTLKLTPYNSLYGMEILQPLCSLREIGLFFTYTDDLINLVKLIDACPNLKTAILIFRHDWSDCNNPFLHLKTENKAQITFEYRVKTSWKYVIKCTMNFPIANN